MNIEIKGIHLEVTEAIRTYIEKKLPRLDFAREYVVGMLFTISKEGSSFKIEVMINFRWGNPTHVGVEGFDIIKGIDKIFDKIEVKITKEKNKIQEHKGLESVRTTENIKEEL